MYNHPRDGMGTKSQDTSRCPPRAAKIKAFLLLRSSSFNKSICTFSAAWCNSRAHANLPLAQATNQAPRPSPWRPCKARWKASFGWFGCNKSSKRSCRTSEWPKSAATCNGVTPKSMISCKSAVASNKKRQVEAWPLLMLRCTAVAPSQSWHFNNVLESVLAANKLRQESKSPAEAAKCKAVRSLSLHCSGRKPKVRSSSDIFVSLAAAAWNKAVLPEQGGLWGCKKKWFKLLPATKDNKGIYSLVN